MNFEFATATRIIFGAGKLKEIGVLAREFGKHPLVVTGRNMTRAQPLLVLLDESAENFSATAFSISGEPTLLDVQKGVSAAKTTGCDFVISALDFRLAFLRPLILVVRRTRPLRRHHAGSDR